MGCKSSTWRKRHLVHSDGTATPIFIVVATLTVEEFSTWRMQVDFESSTGALEVSRGWRGSTDGVTWSSVTAVGSYFSTAGWEWATGWQSMTAAYRHIQVGFLARNVSGSKREAAMLDIIIEAQPA